MATDFITTCKIEPEVGTVTWDSEGTEGGKFHSRKLHVPTDGSGLTLGRGYDMRRKSSGEILNDLTAAGVPLADAKTISRAAGLYGEDARKFITDNKLEKFEIEQCAQKSLFDITYESEAKETKRLCEKADVAEKYGACDWDGLDSAIQEMLVDLKFRGDYTPTARTKIQKHVAANDLENFAKEMTNRDNWPNVPKDRFDRRKVFVEDAVKEREKQQPKGPPVIVPFVPAGGPRIPSPQDLLRDRMAVRPGSPTGGGRPGLRS